MTLHGDEEDTLVHASFDRIADRYDETRFLAEHVLRRIAEELERELTTDCRILEAGVGTGRIASPLMNHGFDIVGLDISRRMLSRARSKGLSAVMLADVTALPFADNAFDHVLSVHVTHLIGEWKEALREMSRVASGRLVSVVTEREECGIEAMQLAYEELCAEMGHEVRHPGLEEKDISNLASPARIVHIADIDEAMNPDEAIERYRSRAFSDQWDVPDEVHEHAIEGLVGTFGSAREVRRVEHIRMMLWSMEDIREAAWRSAR